MGTEFMKDPLYRFVEEQFYEASKLLQTVREDLQNSLIWIEDGEVEDTASLRSVELSLGCIMNPKQFLEATKETVSKMNYTPKEDLELHLKPSDKSSNDVGFDVNSLVMQGASFRSGR